MMHLYDRATIARALTLDLDPQLRGLLTARLASLVTADYDLTDCTEYLILDLGDDESDIVCAAGFSPLVEPIDGIRFGRNGFYPFWDWLIDHGGWFEMTVSFGSTFAYILFIRRNISMPHDLMVLCEEYASRTLS